MTDQELEEIQTRYDATTKGPWEMLEASSDDPETQKECADIGTPSGSIAQNVPDEDADFLATYLTHRVATK